MEVSRSVGWAGGGSRGTVLFHLFLWVKEERDREVRDGLDPNSESLGAGRLSAVISIFSKRSAGGMLQVLVSPHVKSMRNLRTWCGLHVDKISSGLATPGKHPFYCSNVR